MPRRRVPTLPVPPLAGGGPTFNVIGNGRFSSSLGRFLGIRGGAPAPQLAPDVVATVDLDSAFADRRFLLGVFYAGMGSTQPAVVGQNGAFSILNPSNSGALIVVERLGVSCAQLCELRIRPGAVTGTPLSAKFFDSRVPLATNPAGQATRGSYVGPAAEPIIQNLFSGVNTNLQVVLAPGFAMEVACSVVNVALTVDAQWSERRFPPEESISG